MPTSILLILPTSILASSLLLYADETKCYRAIHSLFDCYRLQLDLNLLQSWSLIWKLNFNPQKCKVMSITNSRSPYMFNYQLDNNVLERVESMKDLGVVIDKKLSWNIHIQGAVSKANRVLWLLKRALGYEAPHSVSKQLYESFVRSMLEYCPQVWGGTTKANIMSIERVQRHATNFILGYPGLDYKERLSELHLLPLSYRREYLDLCFIYKCLHSEYNIDVFQFINIVEGGRETRFNNNTMRLRADICSTETFKRSYFNRIVNAWNLLPDHIRLCPDTENFKKMVKDFYYLLLTDNFDAENVCTWRVYCHCTRCRPN